MWQSGPKRADMSTRNAAVSLPKFKLGGFGARSAGVTAINAAVHALQPARGSYCMQLYSVSRMQMQRIESGIYLGGTEEKDAQSRIAWNKGCLKGRDSICSLLGFMLKFSHAGS